MKEQIIEDYVFLLQVITDGSCTFSRRYFSAVEAVSEYNKFVDHGTCRYQTEIVLIEPNGEVHNKLFVYPQWDAVNV